MLDFNAICSDKPSIEEAASDILTQLSQLEQLVKVSVFIGGKTDDELNGRKQLINAIWDQLDRCSQVKLDFVAQKPLNSTLAVEYLTYSGSGKVEFTESNGTNIVEIKEEKKRAILLSGIEDTSSIDITHQAQTIFTQIHDLLQQFNYAYNNIIRQWNYIPGILSSANGMQHYQAFNDVRSNAYDAVDWITGYPAATGIGVDGTRLSIDLMAFDGFEMNAVTNPDQIDAHIYSDKVLEKGCQPVKTTPKFERAKLLQINKQPLLFISGTAAIEGEDSVETSVNKQTELTLQHIHSLCQFAISEVKIPSSKCQVQMLRAYVKYPSDMEQVEKICMEKYPEAALICVEADVCRDELLVEIEAFVKITC
jgi:enamine deaminase RidA (YjgF/YER057c/UK114 family)